MSHKFQIYGGENEEVERFEQITRALRARYEPGCCGGPEPVQLARRGQGRESRSSAYADRRHGQRVIAKRCGPRGQRTEEIGTVAGAEGVGPRCRLSGRAQVVHQVARRQRPADRAFAEAVSVRTSAPDFMSPNGNAAASSRSKDYSRGRGGYRPSLRPFSGRQEPQVSARSSFSKRQPVSQHERR